MPSPAPLLSIVRSGLEESVHVGHVAVCDADGSNLERVSFNQSDDFDPTLLPDGRIMFTRWEHFGTMNRFPLFFTNPDGSGTFHLYGPHSRNFFHPTPTPDGRLLAIESTMIEEDAGPLAILKTEQGPADPLVGSASNHWDVVTVQVNNDGAPWPYGVFKFPHAISVPCGLKDVNSQTVWYCEGRVVTAEEWGDQSGAVEHYLGIQGSVTAQPQPDANNYGATFGYSTTDHATHGLVVWGPGGEAVRRSSLGLKPPGAHTGFWNGYTDAGTSAPTGTYTITMTLNSAYSCSGQAWCATGISFQPFYHQQEPPPSGCGHPPPCPEAPPISQPTGEPEPTTLFFRQRVVADPRPLARVTGQPAIAAAPLAAQPGALS